ncbi:MAG: hypothetical protein ACI8V4_002434, partial [Ilumatobacter sp.]
NQASNDGHVLGYSIPALGRSFAMNPTLSGYWS